MLGKDPAWTVAAAISAAFVVIVLLTTADYCSPPALSAYLRGDAGSCWEFWLNRYQTLVGAGAALFAGLITVVAIRQQTERNWNGIQMQLAQVDDQRRREQLLRLKELDRTVAATDTLASEFVTKLVMAAFNPSGVFAVPTEAISKLQASATSMSEQCDGLLKPPELPLLIYGNSLEELLGYARSNFWRRELIDPQDRERKLRMRNELEQAKRKASSACFKLRSALKDDITALSTHLSVRNRMGP